MKVSPNNLTLDLFKQWIMKNVEIHFTSEDIRKAQIVEVNSLGGEKNKERTPFSMVLHTTMKEAYYEQGTFRVILPDKREVYLFMVPIGLNLNTGNMQYEVVYN